ncbi:hypothetical protein [Halorarum halobium]|uniref:hypothetical protein n=1 Tax=Halorarum halobium TaxID=3075121 RepID=UPI0028A79011|nr:hypothetical protein [Halobaculum sp. XH14]
MDIGGGILGDGGEGGARPGDGYVESDRLKTVLVLVGFLVLFFGALVVVSYV